MREWRTIPVNVTTREVIESFNVNANSARFLDYVTGTIMSNGLLFTGMESVEGSLVIPLTRVHLTGVVNSNTIFDNFRMYFRETNHIVELDNFPVDLTSFNDNKPHFLYFKEDKSYRVSDYIFGQSDEVMICRFIINEDSTWNQMYITAQRAGTPIYHAGEEFYELDGINVKSPGGLELSHTDGQVRRSGIEFNDSFSPDLHHDYSNSATRCPIRYADLNNEIDYNEPVVYDVDPNHYMSYDFNAKKKTNAAERIRNVFNAIYGIEKYARETSEDLNHALVITSEQDDLREIVNVFQDHMDNIYLIIGELGSYMSDSYFSTIDLTEMNQNIIDYNTYSETYFADTVEITEDTVKRIREAAYFLVPGNASVCADPIEEIMKVLYDKVAALIVARGVLKDVPEGKHTIQRILWDIYEQCLIVQYGDTVYDSIEDAVGDVGNILYPVPWGHLFYIPLSALIVKQGCTDLNLDPETVFIIKQYMYADVEQEGFADYVARALANKALKYIYGILDGTYPVGKADTLKHTDLITGTIIEYDDGDFFLNYDNLRNRITIVNNLNENAYNNKHALSAYQGYILNQNKLARDGSQSMTGSLLPQNNEAIDLGSSAKRWRTLYVKNIDASGDVTIGGTLKTKDGAVFVKSGGTNQKSPTVNWLEASSRTAADASWGSYQNGTVVVCW